jgi:hypothetical protein
MADDFVTVVLRRKTAEELVNAYIIALGGSSYQKGKGKKKDGGGEKYGGPTGKPQGKSGSGVKLSAGGGKSTGSKKSKK